MSFEGIPALDVVDGPTSIVRRVLRQPRALVSAVWIGFVVLSGALSSWISPFSPKKSDINDILASPGRKHLLGTDTAGRDVLSRLLHGSRTSLLGVVLCVVLALLIGVTSGLVAGYFGGKFDAAASWVISLVMALPGIVVLLAVRAVAGGSLWVAMGVFGVLISPAFYRLVHVTVRGVRGELFVDAAKVSGLTDRRIIGRHILGVVRAPIIIQVAIVSSISIAIQAGLAQLGFGDTNIPTWGGMLAEGFSKIYRQPWLMLWPSLAIGLTTISLAIFANAVRDELEGGRAKSKPPLSVDATLPGQTVDNSDIPPVRSSALISVRGLTIGYPAELPTVGWKQVVDGVSFDVQRGEILGVVGESGSGKTQTAFAILGLLPSGGRVLGGSIMFDGEELVGAGDKVMDSVRGRRISYVPQEPMSNLDPSFTVGSQLVEPLRLCLGLSKAAAKQRALELLARVGLPDPARTFASYPHELSGGMAQRVLIAGAVSCEPDLIIADEPTTALDVTVQAEILDLLRDLQRELNTAMILVTHNFGVVADLCDRVAVMQEGQIVETGLVRDIFKNPQHAYTQSLLAAILEDAPARGAYREPVVVS
jgi:peptide/nickel transport system permease protein